MQSYNNSATPRRSWHTNPPRAHKKNRQNPGRNSTDKGAKNAAKTYRCHTQNQAKKLSKTAVSLGAKYSPKLLKYPSNPLKAK